VIVPSCGHWPSRRHWGKIAARVVAGALVTFTFIAVSVPPALALHNDSRPVTRLTFGGSHSHTPGRQWSTRALSFSSDVDLLGNGSTGRQLFIFDLYAFDCNHGTTKALTPCFVPPLPSLIQVTSGPGSPDNPSMVFRSLNQVVAFDADGSFMGDTGAAANHRQIYLMDIITGEIIQMTSSPDGDSVRPMINTTGIMVAFESTAPLLGGAPGVSQIFVYQWTWRLAQGVLRQVTAGQAPSTAPSLTGVANPRTPTLITFQSAADLLGDGHDTGVSQIFLATVDWLNNLTTLQQLTNGNAPSRRPQVAGRRDFVAFESDATNLPGATGSQGTQIYGVPIGQGNLPRVEPFTTFDAYGNCSFPSIADMGDRVAFICDGDPLQNGTVGDRAFVLLLDRKAGLKPMELQQITGRGNVKGPLGTYMGRTFLTLADNTDLTGEGVCDYQLYLVDNNPQGFYWHSAKKPGDLPDDLTQPPPAVTNVLGNHNFVVRSGLP